jgi:hypothetical protein
MPKSNPALESFNAGELSPRLAARLDFSKYPAGLETCENALPLPEGGATRRPATRYVAELEDSSVKGRLLKFEFSTTQAYVIELGDQVMRFYRYQAQIISGTTSASIANGTFGSDITSWTDRSTGSGSISWSAGQMKIDPGGIGTTDIGWAEQVVTNSDATEQILKFQVDGGSAGDRLELRIGTTSTGNELVDDVPFEKGYHCHAFTATAADYYVQFRAVGTFRNTPVLVDNVSISPSAAGVELQTPYLEADLPEINGPQSADTRYLYHPSYPTYKVLRFGHTSWSLVEVEWIDGPYLDENITATTLATANVGYAVAFTASDTVGINDDQGFLSTDVGRSLRWQVGQQWGWGHIVGVASTTSITVDVRDTTEFVRVWQVDVGSGGTTYVDETADANSDSNNDFAPFPTSETTSDYCAFGMKERFSEISFDFANGTKGEVGGLDYHYWNGTAWVDLDDVTDETNEFTLALADDKKISWIISDDWEPRSIFTSEVLYYMRVKVRVTYTTNPIFDRASPRSLVSSGATTAWRLGAWSETTGYPAHGAFYEQRQFSANTTDQPQTFWATQTADFENHRPDDGRGTVEDDDALSYTISADEVNAIRWLSAGESSLALGTSGGEWIPESNGIVLTPLDAVVRRHTTHGSANIQPVRVGNVVLFVQSAKRRIREFAFAFEVDGFRAPDMSRLAAHITKGGIVEMAYQQEPDSVVWAVRDDGQLLSMTYRREEDVVGWARHIIGGSFSSGNAVVESIATIPGADGTGEGQVKNSESRDEVWITVKRTIDGGTKRYIEVLEGQYENGDDIEHAYYGDSGITYDGSPATSITGLDHLEGETVKVFADGVALDDETVSSGSITIASSSVVQIGLSYTHTIKPLKLITGTQAGTPMGKTKQIFGMTFVVLDSQSLSFGPDTSNLRAIDLLTPPDDPDSPYTIFTGERFEEWDDDWKADPRMVIQSSDPAPFTLLALAPETDTHELK